MEIEELLQEIKRLQSDNRDLYRENTKVKEQNKKLKLQFKEIQDQLACSIQELKDEKKRKKIHNERGAGRKSKFTEHQIETIKMYRLQGMSIKAIAELFNCSVGLIHKLISEK